MGRQPLCNDRKAQIAQEGRIACAILVYMLEHAYTKSNRNLDRVSLFFLSSSRDDDEKDVEVDVGGREGLSIGGIPERPPTG